MNETNSDTESYDYFERDPSPLTWQVATAGTVITFAVGFDNRSTDGIIHLLRGTTPDGYESVIEIGEEDEGGVVTDAELSMASLYVIASLVDDDDEGWGDAIAYYEDEEDDDELE